MTNKKYFVSIYEGNAVYEPAEGGYYVPETRFSDTTATSMSFRHARRFFRQMVKEMTEAYGEPCSYSGFRATFRTGRYIGDYIVVRMESIVGLHEAIYQGYC